MPMCAMTGCSARSTSAAQKMDLEPRTGLYRLPKVITRQCDRTKVLSEQRRRLWLARINRKGLKNLDYLRVCGRRFISGKQNRMKRKLQKINATAYNRLQHSRRCVCSGLNLAGALRVAFEPVPDLLLLNGHLRLRSARTAIELKCHCLHQTAEFNVLDACCLYRALKMPFTSG